MYCNDLHLSNKYNSDVRKNTKFFIFKMDTPDDFPWKPITFISLVVSLVLLVMFIIALSTRTTVVKDCDCSRDCARKITQGTCQQDCAELICNGICLHPTIPNQKLNTSFTIAFSNDNLFLSNNSGIPTFTSERHPLKYENGYIYLQNDPNTVLSAGQKRRVQWARKEDNNLYQKWSFDGSMFYNDGLREDKQYGLLNAVYLDKPILFTMMVPRKFIGNIARRDYPLHVYDFN